MSDSNDKNEFQPARTLEEVAAQAILEPLAPGDARYTDLSEGRSTHDLLKLKQHIKNCRVQQRYAAATLTGHRGCGKSTELKRLIEEMRGEFEPFYVEVDATIQQDCDYPDLFLWLVDALLKRLAEYDLKPDEATVKGVYDWFAEKYLEQTQVKKAELAAEIEASTGGGLSVFGLGIKLLARVKSVISGSIESRQKVRLNVSQYADTLIDKLNVLLNQVAYALKQDGRKDEILIVVDNLDRLEADAGRRLFITNGPLLKRLDAHVIFTVPIAVALAPDRVGLIFESGFSIPTMNPKKAKSRDALIELIAERIDIDAVFENRKLVTALAKASGGSLRDLIRLLGYAQLEAQVTNGKVIDRPSINEAIKGLREDYKKSLVPAGSYFPLLARIHSTGSDGLAELAKENKKQAEEARIFLRDLLNNGAVLEYNGDKTYFAVHPAVQQIDAFKRETDKLAQPGEADDAAD